MKLAKYIGNHYPLDIILSSPLKRARRTAEVLKEAIGCDLVIAKDLMEFNNGVLAGLSRQC